MFILSFEMSLNFHPYHLRQGHMLRKLLLVIMKMNCSGLNILQILKKVTGYYNTLIHFHNTLSNPSLMKVIFSV